MLAPIYGAYQENTKKLAADVYETTFDIWLTANGMEQLCQQYGFNKNDVLGELAEMRMLETKTETIRTTSGAVKTRSNYLGVKYFAGRSWRTHHLTYTRQNDAGQHPKAEAKQPELIKKPRDVMPD